MLCTNSSCWWFCKHLGAVRYYGMVSLPQLIVFEEFSRKLSVCSSLSLKTVTNQVMMWYHKGGSRHTWNQVPYTNCNSESCIHQCPSCHAAPTYSHGFIGAADTSTAHMPPVSLQLSCFTFGPLPPSSPSPSRFLLLSRRYRLTESYTPST